MNGVGIELHVPDFHKMEAFYTRLGFGEVRRDETYRVMKREDVEIAFYGGTPDVSRHNYFEQFPADTTRGYGVEIIIPVDDIDALYALVKDSGAVVASIQDRHWGLRDFRLADPFGYYLRFTSKNT